MPAQGRSVSTSLTAGRFSTMLVSLRWTIVAVVCFASVTTVRALNESDSTGTHIVSAAQLDNNTTFGVCVYPTSVRITIPTLYLKPPLTSMRGSYSRLNRMLYYCTLIFALISRAHLWLIAGALAAALTYSGAAAVHACLLAWRGPNPDAEQDVWPLVTILSTACLITVPLLSWSGTLRRLGAKVASARDKKRLDTQSDAGTRTIVVYWAFLVFIGYISIWVAIQFQGNGEGEYPDMSKVICRTGTNASLFMSADGSSHKRAIDQQFITDNACNNPCDLLNVPSIFRQKTDLVLLDYKQALLWDGTLTSKKYDEVYEVIDAQDAFDTIDEYMLLFILLQGFITLCFGRRDPREIRDLIYIKLVMEHHDSKRRAVAAMRDWTGRTIAFLSYLTAVVMVIICPLLFVAIIVDQEWTSVYEVSDSESMTSVGQWGPWAVTVQVVLAALIISPYHDKAIGWIARRCRHVYGKVRGRPVPQGYVEIGLQPQQSRQTQQTRPNQQKPVTPDLDAAPQAKDYATVSFHTPPATNPIPTAGPKHTWTRSLKSGLHTSYKACLSPLNQSDRGIYDEFHNFIEWCKDPKSVSRLVVRHPIRPKDEVLVVDESVTVDTDGTDTSQERRHSGFFRAASTRKAYV